MTQLLIQKRVLVLGEDTRSFLSVIRSLGAAGMEVDIVTLINTTPALRSKYIKKVYKLNYQAFTQIEYSAKVTAIIEDGDYDLIVPCDERSLYPLLDIQEAKKTKATFAIPDRDILGPLFDKEETRKLAVELGINVASGEHCEFNDTSSEALISKYSLPLVLKPTKSYESEQLNQRNTVLIARSISDIELFKQQNDQCLVEQFFEGTGMGVSVFSWKGKVRAAFAHKRVSEPEHGGGSSYRKACLLPPDMLDACQKICIHLNYSGVAMFEFKYNSSSNEWILIEINARFWGSLPLAIFAGVDFPKILATYLLTNEKSYKLTYNLKAHARSLTSDLYDIKASFERNRTQNGTAKALSNAFPRLFGFIRLLTGNDTIDTFQWGDTRPFFSEINELIGEKIKRRFRMSKHSNNAKQYANLLAEPINEILVVCYGNIMRSPFAANLLKKKFHRQGINVVVKGAGFHQLESRPSPERCILEANKWGVDLSSHRSSWLSQSMIKSHGQLVIYFDLKHEYLLNSYYHSYRALNLAHFVPPPAGPLEEIADPYDGSPDALEQCYLNISSALDEFLITLTASNSITK